MTSMNYELSVIAVLLCHTFYSALTTFCTGNSDWIHNIVMYSFILNYLEIPWLRWNSGIGIS